MPIHLDPKCRLLLMITEYGMSAAWCGWDGVVGTAAVVSLICPRLGILKRGSWANPISPRSM